MNPTYRIRDWTKHFETFETKRLKRLTWIPTPNKHDGKGFRTIADLPNATEVYCAWQLILQVASKCPVRGTLADKDGPLTSQDLRLKTGFPRSIFEAAFNPLMQIGWLERDTETPADSPQITAEQPQDMRDEGKGREGKGITATTTTPASRVGTKQPMPVVKESLDVPNNPKPSIPPMPEKQEAPKSKPKTMQQAIFGYMLAPKEKKGLGLTQDQARKADRMLRLPEGFKSNDKAKDRVHHWTDYKLGCLLWSLSQPDVRDPLAHAMKCRDGKILGLERFEEFQKKAKAILDYYEPRVRANREEAMIEDTGAENVEVQENSEVEP